MDLSNALLLVAAVTGTVELLKSIIPTKWLTDQIKVLIVVAVSFGATFLIAATAWADEQVIGGQDLAHMSVADKVLVSIFVAGAASLTHKTLAAVRNIGQNQLSDTERILQEAAMARAVTAPQTHEVAPTPYVRFEDGNATTR